ncbi:hypothetical protein EV360DRAFT_77948 [Lentinula raphanica]|nr:hypothetical protein EV360DRAFT_77948 [Lentinula raphanica]
MAKLIRFRAVFFNIHLFTAMICHLAGFCSIAHAAPAYSSSMTKSIDVSTPSASSMLLKPDESMASQKRSASLRGYWRNHIMQIPLTKEDQEAFCKILLNILLTDSNGDRQFMPIRSTFAALPLRGIQYGSKLPQGGNSVAVYDLKGTYKAHNGSDYDGSDLVIKILRPDSHPVYTLSEAKALKIVGDFVDSGILSYKAKDWAHAHPCPAIIMKKVPGKLLDDLPVYQRATPGEKKIFRRVIGKLVCAEAGRVAFFTTPSIVHENNHKGNVLIELEKEESLAKPSVRFVDYAWPQIFFASEGIKPELIQAQVSSS